MPLALIPLVALCALTAGSVLFVRRSLAKGGLPRPSAFCWLAAPALMLIAAIVWCWGGLYLGGAPELVSLCAAALVAGAAALLRDPILAALDARAAAAGIPRRLPRALLAILAIATGVALGFLAMELPYAEGGLAVEPRFALIEALLVLGALTFLYFLFQRRGSGIALGVGACAFIGLTQFFVASFKASAILPNDLFVLGTAAAVSGSYVYSVDGRVLLGLTCLLVSLALCALVLPIPAEGRSARARSAAANLAAACLAFVALWAGATLPSYFDDLGVGMEYWYTLTYYRRQGFLTSFVAVAQDLPVEEPEGYSAAAARDLEASYVAAYDETRGSGGERSAAAAQFDESRPTVICIMNETFSDLSCLDGDSWGYEGLGYLGQIPGRVLSGDLAVSVLGGGTCNSEFEFLTGIPLAYVGDGKYPYSLYDLSAAPSLARQFSELGYRTTAMHPNYATNWNRDRVYEALGFDEFLTIDDFPGAEWYHSGVSDAETYDRILRLLDEHAGPQLIFDVTMQNHSSYDQNNIGEVEQYHVDGVSDYDNGRLSEYLGCIAESERALEGLLSALEELDRPVIVLFFGDHQPALSSIVNDAVYPDESDELAHNLRVHETTYFVWANYDIAGAGGLDEEATSVCYLGSLLAEKIGAPLTDYQKAQLVAWEEMPALSLLGARDASGAWTPLDETDALPSVYDDLAQMSYLEFASKLE